MNYLVLTPDGVGSTYLQRAITVYLNANGEDYYNTHELLNGLELDYNNNLYKKMKGYSQSIEEIVGMIEKNEAMLVSRLAHYHVLDRLAGKVPKPPKGVISRPIDIDILERNRSENYDLLYDACNDHYGTILCCTRDPFEYALSWGIRDFTGVLNCFSLKEKADTVNFHMPIDLEFFRSKLDQYKNYMFWVHENFDGAKEVQYEDLVNDVDLVLYNITDTDYDVKRWWGTTLQEYSVQMYQLSLTYNYRLGYSDKLLEYQKALVRENKLYMNGMPIKMNTLREKSEKVTNFSSCLDVYNDWAKGHNHFEQIDNDEIINKMKIEDSIYHK